MYDRHISDYNNMFFIGAHLTDRTKINTESDIIYFIMSHPMV